MLSSAGCSIASQRPIERTTTTAAAAYCQSFDPSRVATHTEVSPILKRNSKRKQHKTMPNDFREQNISHTTWITPDRYDDLQAIGQGAYGAVCSALDTQLNRRVAIKKLTKPFHTAEYGKRTYRELNMLKHMDHENIVCLIDVFSPQKSLETFNDVYLVTPLMGADLNSIVKTQRLGDEHIQFLIYQILRALKYLHSAEIIHRDLKPCNIAVNEDCELKILDFGLARQRDDEMTGYVATRWYRAPEIMLQWMHYRSTVDVWSVGCIMAELITGRPLFPGNDHIDQLKRILALTGKPDEEFMAKISSPDARTFIEEKIVECPRQHFSEVFVGANLDAIDLLDKMLILDPDSRITAASALEHPYLQHYHDEDDEPESEPYIDPHENEVNVTVEKWKEYVWESMKDFTPKLGSILAEDQ